MSRRVPRGGLGPEWPDEPDDGQAYGDQGVQHNGYRPNGYNGYNGNGNWNGAPGQGQQQHQYGQYGGPGRGGPADYGQQQPYGGQGGNGHGPQPGPAWPGPGIRQPAHADVQLPARRHGVPGERRPARPRRLQRRVRAATRMAARREICAGTRTPAVRRPALRPAAGAGAWWPGTALSRHRRTRPPARKVRFRRTRRFFRRRSVRIVSARDRAVPRSSSCSPRARRRSRTTARAVSANLAEWARDHYLGPVVTFGEWLSYNPPPKGGKPSFSLAVPSGEAVSPSKPAKTQGQEGLRRPTSRPR